MHGAIVHSTYIAGPRYVLARGWRPCGLRADSGETAYRTHSLVHATARAQEVTAIRGKDTVPTLRDPYVKIGEWEGQPFKHLSDLTGLEAILPHCHMKT